MDDSIIQGFSKYNKQQRIDALIQKYDFQKDMASWLATFENTNAANQKIIDDLSENPISSFLFSFFRMHSKLCGERQKSVFSVGFRRKFGGGCFG